MKQPRRPQPFFRKFTQSWYLQLGKRQINLGPDKKAAWDEYHRIMASREALVCPSLQVSKFFEAYLEWVANSRSPATYRPAVHYLSSLASFLGKRKQLRHLTADDISTWLDSKREPQDDSERFVNKRPTPPLLPEAVWINPPAPSMDDHEKGLPKTVGSQKPDAPSAHPRSGYPLPGCVPAEPDSVSPDTVMLPDSILPKHPPSDTRAMPQKIPGAWGLAPT